jgi:uncharacterized phage protein (TIGR01671 family)
MREVLFRGKRVDNGEWVYGNLIVTKKLIETIYRVSSIEGIDNGKSYIFRVIPETIGQYIGLISNDEKLFTGDIVRMSSGLIGVIKDATDICGYEIKWLDKEAPSSSLIHQYLKDDYEIIGNIHDNPELLGV